MKTALAWIYGLQCFIVVPWFLGAFYRAEMSTVPWREFSIIADRHGLADALLGMYLYGIFYSLPPVLALVYLPRWLRPESRIMLSAWFAYSFFLFMPSLLDVFRRGWLFGGWVIVTVLTYLALAPTIREVRSRRQHDT
jgi:hypothetical protein